MRSLRSDPELTALAERVFHHAAVFGRSLPEIRFFILDGMEFASLLEKNVYPTSPLNIWEGKRMVNRRHRIETGQESSLYYEVVQSGNPAYAYLNHGNPAVTQASVMAHVVGHCEFSELNVLRDSNPDRTEYVMYLVKKVALARQQMGQQDYVDYWNACESMTSLLAPNSQFSLERSVATETEMGVELAEPAPEEPQQPALQPVSTTLNSLLRPSARVGAFEREVTHRRRRETLSRRGYALRAPCEDVMGFLRHYAPASRAERAILEYQYVVRAPQDFVRRTQIMNEGWAMYWEKKIMGELFKERAVTGIIEYCRVFSGVCYPRPFFQRNPYHLGYNLWTHVEQLYRDGKVSLEFQEETDQETLDAWHRDGGVEPIAAMDHLVRTITDYEFLRRFLTPELIHEFHLNRVDQRTAQRVGVDAKDLIDADDQWVWLDPEPVREQMLSLYTHFHRPRIYLIDAEFQDGGLLLYHRDDGRPLREDWLQPTLHNLHRVWKGPVALLTRGHLHGWQGGEYHAEEVEPVPFEQVLERMQRGAKPYVGE
jgi:stage V sporulation protein R